MKRAMKYVGIQKIFLLPGKKDELSKPIWLSVSRLDCLHCINPRPIGEQGNIGTVYASELRKPKRVKFNVIDS